MKSFLSSILFFLFGIVSIAQVSNNKSIIPSGLENVVIIMPTGEKVDNLPEMELLSDTTQLYRDVIHLFNNSFLTKSVRLYFLAANYLRNNSANGAVEPAYLALTQNDGGFAKHGFVLKTANGHIEKPDASYVDIVEDRIKSNQNKLMSVTQLYPHEMGHLIYGLLNSSKRNLTSRSVDMHYFSLRTDYSTAFNEGFSEHIENIARLYEENDSIKAGIFADLETIKEKSEPAIRGFEKDLRNPLRLAYYKMTMPIWYQKFEDYKRHQHAVDGTVRYKNSGMILKNIEDRLTYRNSGVRQNKGQLRNYVQMLSTEGVISAFFTQLTQSELGGHYLDSSFYKNFLTDTTISIANPDEIFSPIENQFLKYFFVMYNYMTDDIFSQSQLIDFIEGYISAFPSEEAGIKSVFKDAISYNYTSNLPPDIWLMVKEHNHRLLVLDPHDAITLPLYTFNINAAEEEDWLTIKGIKKEEVERIIDYREDNGFFTNLDQIKQVEGISEESLSSIFDSNFDDEYLDGITVPDLTFSALLTKPLSALLFKSLGYFILIFGLIYGFFLSRQKYSFKRLSSIGLRYFIFWILSVLAGLVIVVMFNQKLMIFGLVLVLIIGLNLIIHRKNMMRMWRSQFATILMGILILLSVV